ncbi:hypothetical protein BE20_01940 [Sorangium cellulosum]|nr:hypothetical protein BE20_01940 [Sorangium cellulosum]
MADPRREARLVEEHRTNSGSAAMCGCIIFRATRRSNPPAPIARPRYTVAMPPDAMARKLS